MPLGKPKDTEFQVSRRLSSCYVPHPGSQQRPGAPVAGKEEPRTWAFPGEVLMAIADPHKSRLEPVLPLTFILGKATASKSPLNYWCDSGGNCSSSCSQALRGRATKGVFPLVSLDLPLRIFSPYIKPQAPRGSLSLVGWDQQWISSKLTHPFRVKDSAPGPRALFFPHY